MMANAGKVVLETFGIEQKKRIGPQRRKYIKAKDKERLKEDGKRKK